MSTRPKPSAARLGLALGLGACLGLASGACKSRRAGDCDRVKADALAAELERADPQARPALLRRKLGQACKLPNFITEQLEEPDAPRTEASIDQAALKESFALMTKACKGDEAARREAGDLPSERRGVELFDRCELERFGVVDRERWLGLHWFNQHMGVGAWAAHQWFLDQGLDADTARSFTRALLAAQRERSNLPDPAGLDLPRVDAPLERPEGDARITVGRESLFVDDERVASLIAGELAPAELRGMRIPALEQALAPKLDGARQIAESRGEGESAGRVLIAADASIPFATLLSVLYTAGRSGAERFGFLADGYGAFDTGMFPVEPPNFRGAGEGQPAPPLLVNVGLHSLVIRSMAEDVEGERIKLDFDALQQRARQYRLDHPGAQTMAVSPGEDVPYASVVASFAALRDCQPRASCEPGTLVILSPNANSYRSQVPARAPAPEPGPKLDE